MRRGLVIGPTYNRAALVGRAIQSVLNQTYHNLEIIVVNDVSSVPCVTQGGWGVSIIP